MNWSTVKGLQKEEEEADGWSVRGIWLFPGQYSARILFNLLMMVLRVISDCVLWRMHVVKINVFKGLIIDASRNLSKLLMKRNVLKKVLNKMILIERTFIQGTILRQENLYVSLCYLENLVMISQVFSRNIYIWNMYNSSSLDYSNF